ncbi:hypothetical protein BDB00DRAFT_870847 [Zychaea mexicana]|uniref:uncharacterized protein n=1 Tax=Zychaea mexicana TaxID=64656 RepID=UPI0022FEACEC|nr:uncharacterized protein BDB00DRAFT_870847 [Zychaea mexicana]KAI9495132.1 hypothetical protein BDB00DRAFT_870847 [Zychaea mexicana]
MQQYKHNSVIRLDADLLFTVLPHEILCAIFSQLSWGDLVLCLSVHPTWASRIPHYAKSKLSTFEFTTDILSNLHSPFSLVSLGPHVETVIMHQLNDHDCVIKALEIVVKKKCNVKKLKLSECRIFDLERFLQLLNQVGGQTLTELTFELHRDQMPYRHIIAACPKLTHFACDLDNVTHEPALMQQQQQQKPSTSTMTLETFGSNITYLSVNILLQRDDRLYPLLRMCPQLRCLVLGYGFFVRDGDPHRWRRPFDLGAILDMCPRLVYFQCNSWENNPAWIMHARQQSSRLPHLLFKSEEEQQQQQGGLREFITDHCGIYDSNQIMPLLLQHRNTLEVVKLNRIRKDKQGQQQPWQRRSTKSWLYELDDQRQQQALKAANTGEDNRNFNRLHTLVLKSIESGEPHQVATLIRRCPNLQEISLDGRMVSAPVLDALAATCPHLRRLDLKGTSETKEDGTIIMHALRNFIQHGSMTLKSMRLAKLKAITNDLLLALVGLQELELADLPNISEYGMKQFIASASSYQQKSSRDSSGGGHHNHRRRGAYHGTTTTTNGGALRTLVVKDMHVITEDCLRALSRSEILHTLQLCRCGTLSETGLMELVASRDTNNDKRKRNNGLKELLIDCCTVSIDACVEIQKCFGRRSIRGPSKYWPEL